MLTSITIIPDLKLGVVILTNTANDGGALFSAVNKTIIDGYLGLDDVGWVNKYSRNMQSGNNSADSVVTKVW